MLRPNSYIYKKTVGMSSLEENDDGKLSRRWQMCRDSSLPDEIVDLVDGTLTFLGKCARTFSLPDEVVDGADISWASVGNRFSGSKNITNDLVRESRVRYFYAKL